MDLSILCILPLFLVVSLPSGEAVECYECNSGSIYDKEACANIVPGSRTNFVKNCSELALRDGFPYERCRVIVQDVEGEVRVVRSCATKPDEKQQNRCVDRTGTSKIKVRYCECEGDLCNSSSRIYSSLLVFVTALLGLVFASSVSR